ncbi:MAG: hypothetical protein AMS27_03225 [Bacteroides sp. SM23_62_1]|nr:MAG: hypothetical protein AMS27_03225 [Bacteroides sp. SM23_62_1]
MILFNRVILKNALLKGQDHDTIMCADKITATIRKINPNRKKIELNRLRLDHSLIHIEVDSTNTVNLDFIIENLRNPQDSLRTKWSLTSKTIEVQNSRFRLEVFDESEPKAIGTNLTDLYLRNFDLAVSDFNILNDTIRFRIDHLRFVDQSGFPVRRASGHMAVNQKFLDFSDFYIETLRSEINVKRLNFAFNSYQDFSERGILSKIRIEIRFDPSLLNLHDLGYFVPQFYGMQQDIQLSGRLYGRINNFKARDINLEYMDHLHFKGDFDMNGLPDINQTFMFFDIQNLTADFSKMKSIEIPSKTGESIQFFETAATLEKMEFIGKFTGFYNDFVTYGKFNTGLGQLSSDLSIRPDSAEIIRFKGRLKTVGFNIGRLAGLEETLGLINMNGQVDGTSYPGGAVDATMDGTISLLQIYGYDYHNITLAGALTNKTFDGNFTIEDPNLRMEFYGKIDASDTIPVFDFTANVEKANLYPLNITSVDPTFTMSCLLKANFVGANPDDFDGEIKLVNSLFQRKNKQIQIYDFTLHALQRPDSNHLQLRSDLIDADITGKYNFSIFARAAGKMLDHHFPSLPLNGAYVSEQQDDKSNDFQFSIHFKNTFPITDYFYPDLEIARNSRLYGTYRPDKNFADITGNFSYLRFKNYEWNEFLFYLNSDDSIMAIEANTSFMELGRKMDLEHFGVKVQGTNDSIDYVIHWNNWGEKLYKGNLSGHTYLKGRETVKVPLIEMVFFPSSIVLGDTTWSIPKSHIIIDTTAIEFLDFLIVHNDQYFYVDGKVSENPDDVLNFTFNDINLYNLNEATRNIGIELEGILGGTGNLSNIYSNPVFLSNIHIEDLTVNKEVLGNTVISSKWNNNDAKIHLDAYSNRGNLKTLQFLGDYYPSTKNINIHFELDKLRLDLLYPYLADYLDDLSGIVTGSLDLTGTIAEPVINGDVKLQKVSFIISYLQTQYSFSNDLKITNNNIRFDNFEVYDEKGSLAILNGAITNQYLRNFMFDLNFNTENFYFLNTHEIHNETYWGRAIGTGVINIKGNLSDINLNVSARTGKNTQLFINMNEGSEIQENNFITFTNVSDYEEVIIIKENSEVTGLNMNFDLELTPDAEVQIIFDPKVGDIMKGNGYGNIKLEINSYGKFQMFGDFQIEQGEYLFTLQNIINKRLKVEEGGSISWNGDPEDADIDIKAYYSTKATPADLVQDAPENFNKRYPVDCYLIMTGKMMNPNLQFEIFLPTADEETQNFVKNAITTEEELTKQFLSLLVIQNFSSTQVSSSTNSIAGSGSGMAGATTSELLSNQLSNWLSQISDAYDIGVNYRPGDEITTDQLEVALSTQLLDDRVTIHTNIDVGGMQATPTTEGTNTKNVSGEFDVNVKLTNDGKLSLKAYNHFNDDQLYYTSQYTQGVGFVYREDFNTFGELVKRYWRTLFSSAKKKKDKNGIDPPVSDLD